jgi:nucleoside phosphorylase
MKKLKTLIMAAYHKELKPFCAISDTNFIIKNNIAYFTSCVGAVPATYHLTQFLTKFKPSFIISLNTAGIINSNKLTIGDVVLAKTLTPSSHLKDVYSPQLIKAIQTKPNKLLKELALPSQKLKTVTVYCPQDISSSARLKRELLSVGHDAETMEAYAYHYVANQFNIPIISLLGLTNRIGPKAHAEWLENEEWVCKKMAATVRLLLK